MKMKLETLGVVAICFILNGCSPETDIESSILKSVTQWGTWTDVTHCLGRHCEKWDSVLVVVGPTIDCQLADIVGGSCESVLQDGEHGYYFFENSSLRKAIITGEQRILWRYEGADYVSIVNGDTVLVRRNSGWNEAVVHRLKRP